jgi:hypothetical protein
MKIKIILATLMLFGIATTAQPPQEPHKPPTVEERLKKTNEILQKEIQLNTTQQTAVKKIFTNFFNTADKLHGDRPPSTATINPTIKAKMDNLIKERDEEVKNILTKEQYKKYEVVTKKLHPPKPTGQNEPPPPPPLQ